MGINKEIVSCVLNLKRKGLDNKDLESFMLRGTVQSQYSKLRWKG